jgi:hypothetical protein
MKTDSKKASSAQLPTDGRGTTAKLDLTGPRWTRVRRVAAHVTALAMLPYLIIKVYWTVDGLRGGGPNDDAWSRLDWVAVNGVTVGMAGLAILLGLALGQRWGMTVPGWVLLAPAWVGTGFLVPMVPIMPVLLWSSGGGNPATEPVSMPAWEGALLSASFAGFGIGVAVAFPLYVVQRWPHALAGQMRADPTAGGTTGAVQQSIGNLAAVMCVALGLPQLFWALGGTFGLDQDALDRRDAQWHVLTGNSGLWALIAACGLWALTHRRAGASFQTPMLLTWVGSGMLFAWGTWKAMFTHAVTVSFPPPEQPWELALENHFGALAGSMILVALLLLIAERQRTLPVPDGAARS